VRPQTDARGARADEYHARHQRRRFVNHRRVSVSHRLVRARLAKRQAQRSSETANDVELATDGEIEQTDVRGAECESVLDVGSNETGEILAIRRQTEERGRGGDGGDEGERQTRRDAHLTGRVGELVAQS